MHRLADPKLLTTYMRRADMTGARLGRTIGRSRQFVSQLTTGVLATCSAESAAAIETALGLAEGTLFRCEPEKGAAPVSTIPTRPKPARRGSNAA